MGGLHKDFFWREGGTKNFNTHQKFVYIHFCYALRARQTFFFGGGAFNTPPRHLDTTLLNSVTVDDVSPSPCYF